MAKWIKVSGLLVLLAAAVLAVNRSLVRPNTARADLVASNLSNRDFPYNGVTVAANRTKRWDLPIPVKHMNDPRLLAAMDEIEKQLGTVIFDRVGINGTPDNQIRHGIILSVGTAVGPKGTQSGFTGHVSATPSSTGYPPNFVGSNGIISARFYLNLDNSNGELATEEIAIHELGHAMGFGKHFRDFGDGRVIGPGFWNALRLLYSHPPGTAEANL